MAIKHVWSVLCNRSIVDNQTNNISLLEALEQVGVSLERRGFPEEQQAKLEEVPKAVPYEYSLVSFLTKDILDKSVKADLKLEIVDPSGKKINEKDFNIELPEDKKRMRYITRLTHLFLTSEGIYWFKVSMRSSGSKNYHLVTELPLEVQIEIK